MKTKLVSGVALVCAGLAGLYFKVDYSGWVVFIGCAMAVLS